MLKYKRYCNYYFLLSFILIIISNQSLTQSYTLNWAHKSGSPYQYTFNNSLVIDNYENIITTGRFDDSADFDPGYGTNQLISEGDDDIFVQKFDKNGNLIWAFSIGGTGIDEGADVTTDSQNNIYLTGRFSDTVDFDPGVGIFELTNADSEETFIAKYSPDGNFQWAKSLTGINYLPYGYSIDVSNSGDVYVGGIFNGTTDFDPGPGNFPLASVGNNDNFILKLDSDGNFLWAKSFGGTNADALLSLKIDPFGNVWSTGYYRLTADFDPGVGTFNLTANGFQDVFIQKLDENGNFLFAGVFGSTNGFDNGNDIDFDLAGNVYLTGFFIGNVDFDMGPSTFLMSGDPDYYSIFITKIDNSGSFLWAKKIGNGYSYNRGWSIVVDSLGNSYTSGIYHTSSIPMDFDPGPVTFNMTSTFYDTFIEKLNSNGDFIWAKKVLTGVNQRNTIMLSNNNTIYISGTYGTNCDFDPGPSTYFMSTGGPENSYIMKLGNCSSDTLIDIITACDSLTWINGVEYFNDNFGTYYTNTWGCNSVVELQLTIENSTMSTDIISTCNPSYTWINGIEYFNDNYTATYITTNSVGCDSIVTLNLSLNSDSVVDIVNACDSLVWLDGNTYYSSNNTATFTTSNIYGCDSIIALNLTLFPTSGIDVINACDSLLWIDGITYYNSNNSATYILPNVLSCDSLVTLNLTISNSSNSTDIIQSCNPITWIDGNIYSSNNNSATHILTNSQGCDSIVTLDFTINSNASTDTVESCGPYTWIDGNTYIANNSFATFTLLNSYGCDSIITLNLTVTNIDTAIIKSGIELYSNTTGLNYQWLDCNNGYTAISFANSNIYNASSLGSYALEITDGICVDTSYCFDIIPLDFYNLPGYIPLSGNVFPLPVSNISICDAQAWALIQGGVMPYTYNWFTQLNNENTDFPDSLCEGFHVLKAFDNIGDSLFIDYFITDSINYYNWYDSTALFVDTIYIFGQNCLIDYSLPIDSAFISQFTYLMPDTIAPYQLHFIEITYFQSGITYVHQDTISIGPSGLYLISFILFCPNKNDFNNIKNIFIEIDYPNILTLSNNLISNFEFISFFPNPTLNKTSIILPDNWIISEIEIYSMIGTKILPNIQISDNKITLDLADYSSGLYSIIVKTNQGELHSKLIKY